jgi:hypothetical protein
MKFQPMAIEREFYIETGMSCLPTLVGSRTTGTFLRTPTWWSVVEKLHSTNGKRGNMHVKMKKPISYIEIGFSHGYFY